MAEETKIVPTDVTPEVGQKTRRTFVRSAAAVAVTAPAVAVLLSSTTASAQTISPYVAAINHVLDDFTFGNTNEDIDTTAALRSIGAANTTPLDP